MTFRTIGELFFRLRANAGLTQQELEAAGGPKQSVISRIERGGNREPNDETIRLYATALKLDSDNLREQVATILRKQTTGKPRLGFVHGIGAAPVIAMLMEGKLDMVAASSSDADGPLWVEHGQRPGLEVLENQSVGTPFLAESLFVDLDKRDFDLIIGPAEKFAQALVEGGPLIRCAQICQESHFVFMEFAYFKDDPSHTPQQIEQKEKAFLIRPQEEWWKINQLSERRPGQLLSLRYFSGTIGEDYASLFVKPFTDQPIARSFNESQEEKQFSPAFIDVLEEEKPNGAFRAIVPFPVGVRLRKIAQEDGHGWVVRMNELAEVYKCLNEDILFEERLPAFSVDLMLRRESNMVIEWLNADGYTKFVSDLLFYEGKLSLGLRPDLKIVRNIAAYLGMKPEECAAHLNKSVFKLLLYPEFLPFFDKTRNRRLV